MKNNEYNLVDISNEKNSFVAEYTSAQKVEFSFQTENKDSNKDELNDRKTINDKVEDNVLKKPNAKEQEKKKNDTDKIKDVATNASSSVGHVVVASATVAVASIGAIVGINLIDDQQDELINFLSSEITTNSIDFSFSMPYKLLSYEEDEEQTRPQYAKSVVYTLANGDNDYFFEEPLEGYEEIDENFVVFYVYKNGLIPDTSYSLTIILRYQNPEIEKDRIDNVLASRVFKTQSIDQSLRFDYIYASQTSVSFAFIVDNTAVNFDPESQITPAIQATISDGADYYDEGWIESYEQFDDYSLICYYDFSGLTTSTTYTISIYVSLEQEFKPLGSTTFITEDKPSTGFQFIDVIPEENSVSFSYVVNADYVHYVEGEEYPNMAVSVSATGYEPISYTVMEFSTLDGMCKGEGTVSGLVGATTYTIEVYYYYDNETELLGSQ